MSNEKKWVCCLSLSLCCFLSVAWSSWKLALWLAVPKLISCLPSGEFQPQTVIRYFWVVLSVWVSDFWIECASFLMSTLIMRLINLMNDRFKAWPCCHGYVQQVILFPRACHNQLVEVTSLGLVVSCITLLIKSVSLKYHMFFEPTPPPPQKNKKTHRAWGQCARRYCAITWDSAATINRRLSRKRQSAALFWHQHFANPHLLSWLDIWGAGPQSGAKSSKVRTVFHSQ